MFRFSSPYFLALLVLPLLYVWRARSARHVKTRPAMRVSQLLPEGAVPVSLWLRALPLVEALRPLALALMILALAGPQWGSRQVTEITEGIDIVLAIDLSESMAALDFKLSGETVNRLTAVKAVARDFISRRAGDRIGLVAFGSEAYTMIPLTRDYPAIMNAVEGLKIGAAGGRTAVGDALGVSVKRLKEAPGASKVAIILTDGRSNAGEFAPETATVLAQQAGVKVYAIGVGSDEPAPFVVNDPLVGRHVMYQTAEIDEKTLSDMAAATGGLYFRALDAKGLEEVYAKIDSLEKTTAEVRARGDYRDLYPWLLAPAFALLFLWAALAATRYLRLA